MFHTVIVGEVIFHHIYYLRIVDDSVLLLITLCYCVLYRLENIQFLSWISLFLIVFKVIYRSKDYLMNPLLILRLLLIITLLLILLHNKQKEELTIGFNLLH